MSRTWQENAGLLALRVGVGGVLVAHGVQKLFGWLGGHGLEGTGAAFEQMGRYHPSEPHWYLPLFGVDPFHQGKGYGAALMQHALIPCDRDHTLAYLESTNPKNIPLYERHGFELLDTVQVGASPHIFPMLRTPRR